MVDNKNRINIELIKQIMYFFRVGKKLIDKAKREAKKQGLCTSAFIRQFIIKESIKNGNIKRKTIVIPYLKLSITDKEE